MRLILGIIGFAIGFLIALIAIFMININDSLSTFLFIIAIGIILIGAVFARMNKNTENESLIEVNTETESLTESQTDSAINSTIKITLIQNYPEAEIISNEKDLQQGIFVYNNETYNFEAEDNILFIKQDKKLIKYIYLH